MVDAALPPLAPPPMPEGAAASGVLLGLSGGLDSTVLLHLLAAAPWRARLSIRAIHVCHGLDPAAEAWTVHCQTACAALSVPLAVARVEVDRASGLGLEAAARAARHAAFAAELGEREVLALAHHADDQAETFLLRALRASGPDGLAAMQRWRAYAAGWLWRPLLEQPRSALLAHAHAHGLQWIEDPSNADTTLDRNFLRHAVIPVLRQRWPHADTALARSASLSGEAAGLLAGEDARALQSVRGPSPEVLDANALRALPEARRARVLRSWIQALELPPLPANGIAHVESDLLPAAPASGAAFAWAGACLRRWRNWLHAGRQRSPLPGDWQVEWDGSLPLELPHGGSLQLSGHHRFGQPVLVRARRGGERITLPGRTHSHALKHVLQDAGIAPWEREHLPVLASAAGVVLAAGDRIVSGELAEWLATYDARLAWSRDR